MRIEDIISNKLEKNKQVTVAEIVDATGFSRSYINRSFNLLEEKSEIIKIGKSNKTIYIPANKSSIKKAKRYITSIQLTLTNKDLKEHDILEKIYSETGIFDAIKEEVKKITDYAFLEILNNAIEHSKSPKINMIIERLRNSIYFEITDKGIGVFKNIMKKFHLNSELNAIQELLKGKETTDPKHHSGQGIFFTSKVADKFIIKSGVKTLIFDNLLDKNGDIFIKDSAKFKGTKIKFSLSLRSNRILKDIFDQFSVGLYDFERTKVIVKLFKGGSNYISRSEARRITTNLDKFKEVILDFKKVDTIGQGFADEIFRVWQKNYPKIKIVVKNTNENIIFMINRIK
jgi:anti-sigma regulatory factor (Ser/Thr protein kinase)